MGKVALITGAGSGIGRATALLFARQGARIFLADINEPGGLEAVTTIRNNSGDADFVRTDVGRMEDVKRMIESCFNRFGRLDIIHSNAAAHVPGSAAEIGEDDWDRTQAVCLKATWMIAKCAVPRMLKQGGGVIVITGSVHSVRGYAGYAAYQAAKGGLLALTRSLAADFAPTIRVNVILPGAVVTGMWDGVPEAERERLAAIAPLRRNGTPEDIAQAALFLASDMSSYVTGTSLVVDGGLTSIIDLSGRPGQIS
ncbi:MAG TPA: glucose 1-dehydrogenase [Terriglobales bacterium]|nr:glucose 1-dehydrogenase [Terriglobales bacterium]